MTALRLLCLAFVALAIPMSATRAHPPSVLGQAGEKAVAEEIIAFRKALAGAIAAQDAGRLRDYYTKDFAHTDTSGKTDTPNARIAAVLAGDPVIETAPVEDLVVRVPNDWVAIATATSPITSKTDGKTYAVRWMAVYVRTEKFWALAASQATRSHEIKP